MLAHNSMQYDRLTMNHDFDAVGIVLHSKIKKPSDNNLYPI